MKQLIFNKVYFKYEEEKDIKRKTESKYFISN